MGYYEVDVIVDGTLCQHETILSGEGLNERALNLFIDSVEQDVQANGTQTDVFVQFHDHELGIECVCSQYRQDHKPDRTFK